MHHSLPCAGLFWLATISACAAPPVALGPTDAGSVDAGSVDAGHIDARTATTDAQAACPSPEPIDLHRIDWAGHPSSIYVPTVHEGREGLLHFDTAAWATMVLLSGDGGWVADAGQARLGCRERSVAGYAGTVASLPDVDGLPVLGSAGADLLIEIPALLDVAARGWVRAPDADALAAIADAVSPPHEQVQGVFLVRASFDGRPVRLLLDTGAGHSLWLGEPGRPGDIEHVTTDYFGNELRVHEGTVVLELGGEARTLPILRAPDFPLLDQLVEQLGGDIQGLLGLSAIAALHVDAEHDVLRVVLAGETEP
jgi:hypothetical protein